MHIFAEQLLPRQHERLQRHDADPRMPNRAHFIRNFFTHLVAEFLNFQYLNFGKKKFARVDS